MAKTNRICSIEGCGKRHYGVGWCQPHWQRWKRYGDPLAGGPSKGDAQDFLKSAILSDTNDCIIWPFGKCRNGYGRVWVGGKLHSVHRVVCTETHGPAPTPNHEAAHDNNGTPCDSRSCINPKHLRWATPSENAGDKIKHDTHIRGDRHTSSKITENQAREILNLKGKATQVCIAARFGVTSQTVSSIQNRKSWSWLQNDR